MDEKKIYFVIASVEHDALNTGEYVATVIEGHGKVRGLFAIADNHDQVLLDLAQVIYDALTHSRYNERRVSSINVLETHTFPVER
jgi:hypothetical protein